MVDLQFSVLGSNGDTIAIDGSAGYYLTTGLRGLGIPATDVRIDNSASDGGVWRSSRRAVRELDMPVVVLGLNRADVESKLRRLSNALSDRYGIPKLLAEYTDGSAYELEIHYTGGAETSFGEDAGSTFCRWVLSVQAPDPFWTSRTATQFTLSYQSAVRGLLPNLQQLQVSPSQLSGSFTIDNPGDVEAYPVWTLEGAATELSVTRNGVGFTLTETLVSTDRRVIDTRNATVVSQSGANKYAKLAAAPKLFPLPPGLSTVNIQVSGADSSTKLSGYFLPRREVLF